MKCRWLPLSIGALLLWMASPALAQTYPIPRTQFPFDASRGDSSLDEKIRIAENRVYYFDLVFEFGDLADQDRVSELVGDGSRYPDGRYGKPGIAVPIHLQIFAFAENGSPYLQFESVLYTEAKYGTGANHFTRMIARIRLPPGVYRIRAKTVQETLKLSGIRTKFEIGFDPRASPLR